MNGDDLNGLRYMGVLIFVNLFYLSLMIVLTCLMMHVYNTTRKAPKRSLARKVSETTFFAHFLFLELTLLCKLITVGIMLIHIIGITNSDKMPI